MNDLREEVRKYKIVISDLTKTKNKLENYKDMLKSNIFSLMKLYMVDECEGVKKVSKKHLPSITMQVLNNSFNDVDMANLIVVNVDIEKSIENIMIKKGYNEKIAQGILELLSDINDFEYEDLVIKK